MSTYLEWIVITVTVGVIVRSPNTSVHIMYVRGLKKIITKSVEYDTLSVGSFNNHPECPLNLLSKC